MGHDAADTTARDDALAAALADALRRLDEARALARIGTWEYDLETRRLEWSDELFDIHGVDRSTFHPTVDSFCGLLSPEDGMAMRQRLLDAEATGQGWENDIHRVMPDGQVRVSHGRALVDVDADGRPVRIRGMRQDVTGQRARETQLREAEERFRLAFDEAPIGMALVAPDGRWLRVNRGLSEIVGYSPDEMLQMSFQDITHPDDVSAVVHQVDRLLAGAIQADQIERRYIHALGHVVWVELNVSLARDAAGTPLYFITQVQDVSGRRHTEERLRGSERRFRGLLESAPDAMVIVAADGRIVLVNRQTERMFGFAREELIGQPVETLVPARFRARHAVERRGFSDAPQVRPMGVGLELFGVRRDGEEFPIEISLSPMDTDEGLLVSAAIRDITDRKRAESIVVGALKRERELTERLRELDGIKSEFVATVSHELRTPLTNIVSATDLLGEGAFGDLNDQQRRIVDVLDRNSHRLLELINDLLDLTQMESGGIRLHLAPTDLGELLENAMGQVLAQAGSKGLAVDYVPDRGVGVAVVDRHQLERALVNLLTNAIKFTPPDGSVTVRGRREGDRVQFVVSDTGFGIPDHEKRLLFTRFFRSSIANAQAIQGTGLGLVIVKSIVEAHGGTIAVDSTLGEGTTVIVDLPVGIVEQPPAALLHVAG